MTAQEAAEMTMAEIRRRIADLSGEETGGGQNAWQDQGAEQGTGQNAGQSTGQNHSSGHHGHDH